MLRPAPKNFLEIIVGQISVMVLVFLAIVLAFTAILFSGVANFVRLGSTSTQKQQAVILAEAGIENALYELNRTAGAYSGDATPIQLSQDGSFQTTIVNKANNLKTLIATGYIGDTQNPKSKRIVKVDAYLDGQLISFNYAVQVGNGGVSMANSATVNGNVYSNSNITGTGSSTIDGDAFAVGTISSPNPLVTGTKNPGAPNQPLPQVDYQFWKDAASVGDPESTNCTISNNTSIGPKKYDCDLSITNNAIVTLSGPVWITGNFSMSQGGTTLKLDDNFGSNGTVIVVDGTISLTQGGTLLPTNATPKGHILLATTSTLDPAITISQGGATAIFYALQGGAHLSQTADVVALASDKLTLTNSATLTYETGLATTFFTTGPGGSWQIKKGTYKITQ